MGRPKLVRESKRCPRCRQMVPLTEWYHLTNGQVDGYCKPCKRDLQREWKRRRRRERNVPIRHPRYNARGDVYCNNCHRYLRATQFRRHPQRPHGFWSYCRACTRQLDRLRWTGERRATQNASRAARSRRQRQAVFAERRQTIQHAIGLLRRRGLTQTDIWRAMGNHGYAGASVARWEAGQVRRPDAATAARLLVVLRATADWPLGEPAYRQRAHPRLAELLSLVAPPLASIPVRSKWGTA